METLSGKRVLVTGGTGFIGRHLLPQLQRTGAAVRVLVRDAEASADLAPGIERSLGDLRDQESLRRAVSGCQVVVHLAAMLGDQFEQESLFRQVNVEGTRMLAEAALDAKVERFVHVSSVWAYGLVPREGIDESSPLAISRTSYGDTKMESEQVIQRLCAERALPAVIVQPGDVFGPGDQKWTLGPMELMRKGKFTLIDQGRGLFQPVFIDDLVEGIVLAMENGKVGERYILCGEEVVTFKDYFQQLARVAGVQKLASAPQWLAMTMARLAEGLARVRGTTPPFTTTGVRGTGTRRDTYSVRKAREQLGFRPRTTVSEGIRRVEAALRGEGPTVTAA